MESGQRASRGGLRAPSSAAAELGVARSPAMSASGIAAALSAPSELDSACRMENGPGTAQPPATAGKATASSGSVAFAAPLLPPAPAAAPAAAPSSSSAVGGELELALEEELAMLASAGEGPGENEPPGPAASPAEPELLLSQMRQKEKDLVLAARLGKALLERNQDMSRQYERMYKELTDKLEVRSIRAVGEG